LGYDIGGTKIAVGLCTGDGKILGKARMDNKDTNPDEILPRLADIGRDLIKSAGLTHHQIKGIGIAAPSPSDVPAGIIVAPPNNPYWRNVHIKQYLSDALGIEAYFDNDANAGVLAEWFCGAGIGNKNIIYLTMSTGVGGGIVLNGRLVQGQNFYAGEIGHVVLDINGPACNCGLRGCYEAYCGGRALAQRMQRELAGQPDHPIINFAGGNIADIDVAALVKAVNAGNGYALGLWDEMCLRNAQALGMLINALNPEKIILGTIAWAAGPLFFDPVKKYLPQFCWEQPLSVCELVGAKLKHDIGYYAGAAVALNALYERGQYSPPHQA
jgi:glucokinase